MSHNGEIYIVTGAKCIVHYYNKKVYKNDIQSKCIKYNNNMLQEKVNKQMYLEKYVLELIISEHLQHKWTNWSNKYKTFCTCWEVRPNSIVSILQ